MDLSLLEKLGKVASVPGIALGALVLVLLAILNSVGALPEAWRGPITIVIAVGVLLLALLAVAAWARGQRAGAQIARAEGDHSPASNVDRTKTGGSQTATAKGNNSPASNTRG